MHGELPGAASAFLSVASRVEVATFFRYLREDVSSVDDDDLQAVFQLAFRHLPVLAHRALGRALSDDPEPMGSPVVWNRARFLERADLQGLRKVRVANVLVRGLFCGSLHNEILCVGLPAS